MTSTFWIMLGICIGVLITAVMLAIFKGGNPHRKDRMKYPEDKATASNDKPVRVLVRVCEREHGRLVTWGGLGLTKGERAVTHDKNFTITAELEEK